MIGYLAAVEIAESHLCELAKQCGDELLLLKEQTDEHKFGWVFFYNSRAFVETADPMDALAGNAPFIVERGSGAIRETGTYRPLETMCGSWNKHSSSNPLSNGGIRSFWRDLLCEPRRLRGLSRMPGFSDPKLY